MSVKIADVVSADVQELRSRMTTEEVKAIHQVSVQVKDATERSAAWSRDLTSAYDAIPVKLAERNIESVLRFCTRLAGLLNDADANTRAAFAERLAPLHYSISKVRNYDSYGRALGYKLRYPGLSLAHHVPLIPLIRGGQEEVADAIVKRCESLVDGKGRKVRVTPQLIADYKAELEHDPAAPLLVKDSQTVKDVSVVYGTRKGAKGYFVSWPADVAAMLPTDVSLFDVRFGWVK